MRDQALASTSQAWVTAFLYAYLDYTPIYKTKFLAAVLALRKVPSNISKVLILTDCKFVRDSLEVTVTSSLSSFVLLCRHILLNLTVTWVPNHMGIPENEAADYLAGDWLACPVIETFSLLHFVLCAQVRRYLMLTYR